MSCRGEEKFISRELQEKVFFFLAFSIKTVGVLGGKTSDV
jgi:hypothetical protein